MAVTDLRMLTDLLFAFEILGQSLNYSLTLRLSGLCPEEG